MLRRLPILVRLPLAYARGRQSMAQVLDRAIGGDVRAAVPAFRLHPREKRFARLILERHTRFWLYRTDQKQRSGDFALLDMSSPDPAGRRLWIVDLKLGADVKLGGGGAGNQLSNHPAAVALLQRRGLIRDACPRLAVGDGSALLRVITDPLGRTVAP